MKTRQTQELLTNRARVTRRQLFGKSATGLGAAALATLLNRTPVLGQSPLPGLPHHLPTAKRVVVLWQGGGPSHIDLFDEKPAMVEHAGKDIPDSIRGTTRLSTMSSGYAKWPCLPAIKPFETYGQCGMRLSSM
ncbi:MAG: DUF1501 domain-containing protein, partial [Pirellula sp.]